jgi:pyruvate kinase
MIHSQRPTRAEVTDVANAVSSGTDAVMLSAETAVGDHPVRVIEAMSSICREVERHSGGRPASEQQVEFLEGQKMHASAMANAAVTSARHLGLSTIVAFTHSGSTGLLLSKYRPRASIMAFVTYDRTYWRMALYWGVTPIRYELHDSTDRMLAGAEKYLEKVGLCERGETVVMVAGIPPGAQSPTNLVKLHVIGERLTTQSQFDRTERRRR